ncbi:unnamed protein product [Allacma fusca]|uniref:Uncharacterized protein n=1 Tax=Allacma fusca TaxID=39272 RepID=A0A8J2KIB2_9HEXA|nr:unnamed protein product [Allacma fusca]
MYRFRGFSKGDFTSEWLMSGEKMWMELRLNTDNGPKESIRASFIAHVPQFMNSSEKVARSKRQGVSGVWEKK